ncbi:MAG: F420-0--gamma-glutamyl ligase [Hydrocarboniphaga sp.]|uniref:coenzyme F420-0:L-glutamate ligase n=1 Tax=Hydrocarboniphaga sp. TaxID=2033016 RepID=UPI002605AB65|nr:coenzyme F420-0:L-glutamate ligase [Hydrocarboniphaga sp.]MDB5968625.1 F420-0--gamma-glutamyl ligase [Hydrocarboniphaga sp.]
MSDAASLPGALSFVPISGIPEVRPGDDLAQLFERAVAAMPNPSLQDGDVLVVAQKIVSKAENRYVELTEIEPGSEARALAAGCGKDPRLVELVLRESSEVLRVAPGVLIVRHRLGFVVANAAIDQSNLPGHAGERALLLPMNPDASAQGLRLKLQQRYGVRLAVLVSDSFGRAWRLGVCGTCVGCAGLDPLVDFRGQPDRSGRSLQVTQLAVADQLCATATLVGGEAAEGRPMVIVRGVPGEYFADDRGAATLVRPLEQDLFR